jgi:hypothetical protein
MESSDTNLRELMDQQAISRVLYSYAAGADRRDWALFRSCFCDEVEVDLSSWHGGAPERLALDDWVERVRAGLSGFDATQHLNSNHLIDLDGDAAHATSTIQASHMLGPERVVLGGWYDTHLLRIDDRWRIARSQLNITWREGREELFAEAAKKRAEAGESTTAT